MTLLEFLSICQLEDISPMDKVTVTFKELNRTITKKCVYGGLRYPHCNEMVNHPFILLAPVFLKSTRSGAGIGHAPSFRDIIEFHSEDPEAFTLLRPDEARSITRMADSLQEHCRMQAFSILKEMSVLFPGKKILFNPDGAPAGDMCDHDLHDHGCIHAVKYDPAQGAIVYDFSGFDYVQGTPFVEVVNWCELLDLLMEAVMDPVVITDSFTGKVNEERMEDSFADPRSADWRVLPDPSEESAPVLHALGLIETLKANLIAREKGLYGTPKWDSLYPEEKRHTYYKARYPEQYATERPANDPNK